MRFAQEEGLEYFRSSAKEDIRIKDNFDNMIQKTVTAIMTDSERMDKGSFLP